MTPQFRYIESGPADGFRNMATDEVLLEECRKGRVDGVLRVYQWSPPAVSLGHGQAIDLVDFGRCRELGVDVVRRITGGGAVLHWEEITYCLVLSRRIVPELEWPREFTAMTGAALCQALSALGVEASLSPRSDRSTRSIRLVGSGGPEDSADSARATRLILGGAASPVCFSSGTENEIVVEGRKLAGSAHKFTKEAFFSHGSILTGGAHLKIADLIRSELRPVTLPSLNQRSVCMSDLLPSAPGLEALGIELMKSVETRIGCVFAESRLSAYEETMVDERALEKRRWGGAAGHRVAAERLLG